MRNNLNFIKRTLYKLRHDFGLAVTLVHITDLQVNYKTGAQDQAVTEYTLKKVVRLPRNTSSFFRIGQALGIFNRGGETDRTITEFIVDKPTLPPNLVPTIRDCYIMCNERRYNILRITELDNQLGYLLTTEAYA